MTAYGNFLLDKSFMPTAAVTKFRFVKWAAAVSADNSGDLPNCSPVAANTDLVCGVAQETVPTADLTRGKTLAVRGSGITEMEFNAATAVNPGDAIATDASGRAIKLGATGAGTVTLGVAVTPCTVTGNRLSVKLGGSTMI